jgi:hypothetical protein
MRLMAHISLWPELGEPTMVRGMTVTLWLEDAPADPAILMFTVMTNPTAEMLGVTVGVVPFVSRTTGGTRTRTSISGPVPPVDRAVTCQTALYTCREAPEKAVVIDTCSSREALPSVVPVNW